jgi:hypothetical protein
MECIVNSALTSSAEYRANFLIYKGYSRDFSIDSIGLS